jgi:hypothetical protein
MGDARSALGATGTSNGRDGLKPFAWGLPFTTTFPRNPSSLLARSFLGLNANNSGVVSINVVVACPSRNVPFPITFSRNGMFVFTPRIRNSDNARCIRSQARWYVWPLAITFTSIES